MTEFPTTIKETVAADRPTLAEVYRLSLALLSERPDTVLFGSHAVNLYVDPPRATGDVDFMSTDAETFAAQVRDRLAETFRVAARVRVVAHGRGSGSTNCAAVRLGTSSTCDRSTSCRTRGEWTGSASSRRPTWS